MSFSPPDACFALDGKVIVVTGGYGQLGRRFALELLARGAKVAVIEPSPSPERTVKAFGAAANNPALMVTAGDVTSRSSLRAAREAIEASLGLVWGLINNAALDSPPNAPAEETGPFETYPEASWDKVMEVNVKGVFLACQEFGAAMADRGAGSIVNIASIYGTVSPDQSLYQYRRDRGEEFYKPVAYAASKSSLYNLTRYIAVYWGPKNVRANTLTFAGVFNNQDPQFLERYERKVPLRVVGRDSHRGMADETDYIGPVVFLLSDASRYMTGADLRIDGGFLAL